MTRSGLRIGALVALVASPACRDATQIDVVVSTDVDCDDLGDTAVFVSTRKGPELGASPGAVTSACSRGAVGDIVLVPGADEAGFDLRVVAAVGVDLEQCTPENGYDPKAPGGGCIVARRSLSFLSHESLELPIALQRACIGRVCEPGSTCVDGECKDASVRCDASGCAEPQAPFGGPVQSPRSGHVAVGSDHSCALRSDGAVACWGDNSWGQFGIGNLTTAMPPTPAFATAPGPVDALHGGWLYVCVVTQGRAFCAGENQVGELGNGAPSAKASPSPTEVAGLTGITRLSTGVAHACATTAQGSACWGNNPNGQLGSAVPLQQFASKPVTVPELASGGAVSAGAQATCAALPDGRVQCVGCQANASASACGPVPGQPFSVPGRAVEVASGVSHACALTEEGNVHCWGSNFRGQLGEASLDLERATPGAAVVTSAIGMSTQFATTCALSKSGSIACWGANDTGQVGDGGTVDVTSPKTLAGVAGATDVAVGEHHGCATTGAPDASQKVVCWGNDAWGQVSGAGDGSPVTRPPTEVPVP